jgi:DNA recombination protein RmuC
MASHFEDLGSALRKATEAYNRTIGSLEARVLPSVRRFKDLGVTGADEIPSLEQVDNSPRSLEAFPKEK